MHPSTLKFVDLRLNDIGEERAEMAERMKLEKGIEIQFSDAQFEMIDE